MVTSRAIPTVAAFLALGAWLFPARVGQPDDASRPSVSSPSQPAPVAVDVALGEKGELRGMVVDAQGAPCADRLVSVRQQGRTVAQATTDAAGKFNAPGLRGGAYLVVSQDAGLLCRLWSADAAPPAANHELLLPENAEVARGQNRFRTLVRTVAIVTAIGAAIAIPIILIDDEDEPQHGS